MREGVSLETRQEPVEHTAERRRPLMVELVGLAGAGKTAVLHALRRQSSGIQAGLRIDRVRSLLVITQQAVSLGPAGLGLVRKAGRGWRSSLQHLLRLRTLHTLLQPERTRADRAVVLDEGPVFSLCRLLLFQQRTHADAARPEEWLQEIAQWAGMMDLLIWLDAPNAVLAQRIRDRGKAHEVKHASSQEIDRFLERFRSAYREILERLVSGGRPWVVAIDTEVNSPDQVAATILATIERLEQGRVAPTRR